MSWSARDEYTSCCSCGWSRTVMRWGLVLGGRRAGAPSRRESSSSPCICFTRRRRIRPFFSLNGLLHSIFGDGQSCAVCSVAPT
uniref:Uncharacterized protein n=1 Tax=Hyaloperonospora arabidopsidis (strain Emoy2) TaxID=559515 RepID=M4BH23_HYAAE